MSLKIAPCIIVPLLLGSSPASADVSKEPLLLVSGIFAIPALVTGIGSGTQLALDEPRLGWPIASMVTGHLSLAWGCIATSIVEGESDDADAWAIALTPIVVGAATIALAVVNIVKNRQARERKYLEEIDLTLAPILLQGRDTQTPGIGAAVRFD